MTATLVTGGSGFVGAYVVKNLLAAGDRVVCYDIAPNQGALLDLLRLEELPERLTLVAGDVSDPHQVTRTLAEHQIERIAHLASVLSAPAQQNAPLAARVIVQGSINIFEAAVALGIKHVAWASSLAVYGPRSLLASGVIDNDSTPDPRSVYGACKLLVEHLCPYYANQHGLEATGVRFSSIYGYGKQLTRGRGTMLTWLENLIDRPAVGERGCVVGGGHASFDFQYVEDAARSVVCALTAEGAGGASFLTHGDQRPVRDAFAFVQSLLPDADMTLNDSDELLIFGPEVPRHALAGEQRTAARMLDGQATADAIGYQPKYTMEDGIETTVNELRTRAGLAPVSPRVAAGG